VGIIGKYHISEAEREEQRKGERREGENKPFKKLVCLNAATTQPNEREVPMEEEKPSPGKNRGPKWRSLRLRKGKFRFLAFSFKRLNGALMFGKGSEWGGEKKDPPVGVGGEKEGGGWDRPLQKVEIQRRKGRNQCDRQNDAITSMQQRLVRQQTGSNAEKKKKNARKIKRENQR